MKIIKNEFSDELRNNETDEFYLSQFVWVLYENLSNPFSLKKQIVKYGPLERERHTKLVNKHRFFLISGKKSLRQIAASHIQVRLS